MQGILEGKVALITGAAGGLGWAIAQRFLDEGASIATVDRVALAEPLRVGDGARAVHYIADLADFDETASLPSRAVADLGRLDILVNNAGYREVVDFENHSLAAWQLALDVNLTAPFVLAQASIALMRPTGKGKIVNIASVAASLSFKNRAAYNVSKAGLLALTRTIALELGGVGIRCNSVSPGVIRTAMSEENLSLPGIADIVAASTPLGVPGVPTDIASAVAFLASDASDYISGAELVVDGGWSTGKGF